MKICNGATKGDEEGRVTCIAAEKGSVRDYVMEKSEGETERVSKLEVKRRDESDHLPLAIDIELGKGALAREPQERKVKSVKRITIGWDPDKAEKYAEELEKLWSEKVQGECKGEKFEWENVKEVVWTAADRAGMLKIKKQGSDGHRGWFDQECKKSRKETWQKLKTYLKEVKSPEKRQEWTRARAGYKVLCRKKRDEWWKETWELVKESTTPSSFWKAVNRFRCKRVVGQNGPGKEELGEHFAKLLAGEEGEEVHLEVEEKEGIREEKEEKDTGPLNRDISYEEWEEGMTGLAYKKAAGSDGITAEFLKVLPKSWKWTLWKTTQKIWSRGILPEEWKKALIFPIFKAGDRMDVSNYRGISLLNVGYKLLTGILARRLTLWSENENKIRESQAGFRVRRGTRDHIFTLNALIGKELKEKKGGLSLRS